jgi:hypothetical protein
LTEMNCFTDRRKESSMKFAGGRDRRKESLVTN